MRSLYQSYKIHKWLDFLLGFVVYISNAVWFARGGT